MIENKLTQAELTELRNNVTNFLMQLVAIRSYPNEELQAAQYCFEAFSQIPNVQVHKLMMDNSLKEDPLWCSGVWPSDYTGHFNVEAVWKGTGEQEPVYLCAHMDTVTVSEDDTHLLTPELKGDEVHGIGACDDKGQIASIYTVFRLLSHFNVQLPFNVVAHMVCEEEIGGNGALAVARRNLPKGQAAIVLEATSGCILPIHRCGLWIKMTCHGASCHTSAIYSGKGTSAFHIFLRAYETLKRVHDAYREECRKHPVKYYEEYLPPLNVGMVNIGDWPSKIPPKAIAYASVAVLPNSSNEVMRRKILEAFAEDELLRDSVDVDFVFDRGCSVGDPESPFVKRLQKIVRANGYCGDVRAMYALSDMYFYQEVMHTPTVTYGPGDLGNAHSSTERIAMTDVLNCADIIYEWMLDTAALPENN